MSKTFLCQCGGETAVKDSRGSVHGVGIRRRRECQSCGHRFTTYESPQEEPPQGFMEMLENLQLALATVQSALNALQNTTDKYADAASFLHDVKYGAAAKPKETT